MSAIFYVLTIIYINHFRERPGEAGQQSTGFTLAQMLAVKSFLFTVCPLEFIASNCNGDSH